MNTPCNIPKVTIKPGCAHSAPLKRYCYHCRVLDSSELPSPQQAISPTPISLSVCLPSSKSLKMWNFSLYSIVLSS